MDFEAKWAIRQAHQTLLDFAHLIDSNGPTPANLAKVRVSIPVLSSQAMRCARDLEKVLTTIDADDGVTPNTRAGEWDAAMAGMVQGEAEADLKLYIGQEVEGLRQLILQGRALVDPLPVYPSPRLASFQVVKWIALILGVALLLLTLMGSWGLLPWESYDSARINETRLDGRDLVLPNAPGRRTGPGG